MRRDARRAGFTLLEVLAAVAVLGLVYSVLATAAIQGLRAEGDAGRRFRASLLADQRITEVEAQVAAGQTPEIGETEARAEEFTVRTVVKALDLAIPQTKSSKRAKERLDRTVGARPAAAGAPAAPGQAPAGGATAQASASSATTQPSATGATAQAPASGASTQASAKGAATQASAKGAKTQTPNGSTSPTEAKSLLHPTTGSKQPMLRRIDLSISWAEGESEQTVQRTTFGIDAVAAAPLIAELVAAAEAQKAQNAQKKAAASGPSQKNAGGAQTPSGTSSGPPGTGQGSSSAPSRNLPTTGTDPGGSMGADR